MEYITAKFFKVKLLEPIIFQSLSVEMYGIELNELKNEIGF